MSQRASWRGSESTGHSRSLAKRSAVVSSATYPRNPDNALRAAATADECWVAGDPKVPGTWHRYGSAPASPPCWTRLLAEAHVHATLALVAANVYGGGFDEKDVRRWQNRGVRTE